MPPPEQTRLIIKAGRLLEDLKGQDAKLNPNVVALKRALNELAPFESILDGETRDWLDGLRTRHAVLEEETRKTFGTELYRAMTAAGFGFEGNYPQFRSDLLTIHLNIAQNLAEIRLGPDERLPVKSTHKADEIVSAVTKARTYLNTTTMTAERIVGIIRRVFDRYPRPRYPIIEFLGLFILEMSREDKRFRADPSRETLADYGRARFSYDLHRFSAAVVDVMKLSTATRLETDSREKYLWVPDGSSGSTYSQIEPHARS